MTTIAWSITKCYLKVVSLLLVILWRPCEECMVTTLLEFHDNVDKWANAALQSFTKCRVVLGENVPAEMKTLFSTKLNASSHFCSSTLTASIIKQNFHKSSMGNIVSWTVSSCELGSILCQNEMTDNETILTCNTVSEL